MLPALEALDWLRGIVPAEVTAPSNHLEEHR